MRETLNFPFSELSELQEKLGMLSSDVDTRHWLDSLSRYAVRQHISDYQVKLQNGQISGSFNKYKKELQIHGEFSFGKNELPIIYRGLSDLLTDLNATLRLEVDLGISNYFAEIIPGYVNEKRAIKDRYSNSRVIVMDPASVLKLKTESVGGYSVVKKLDQKKLNISEIITEDAKDKFGIQAGQISEDSTKVLCIHSREVTPEQLTDILMDVSKDVSISLSLRESTKYYLVHKEQLILKDQNLSLFAKGSDYHSSYEGDFRGRDGYHVASNVSKKIISSFLINPSSDSKVTIEREVEKSHKPSSIRKAFRSLYSSTIGDIREKNREKRRKEFNLLYNKVTKIGAELNLPKAGKDVINSCVIFTDAKELKETEEEQTE